MYSRMPDLSFDVSSERECAAALEIYEKVSKVKKWHAYNCSLMTHLRYQKKKCVGVSGACINNPFKAMLQLHDDFKGLDVLLSVPSTTSVRFGFFAGFVLLEW
jgi:hypothetical protein